MCSLQERIRTSEDLHNHYILELLAESEEDVRAGRIFPVEETFGDLRKILKTRL